MSLFQKFFVSVHTLLYKASGGRIGARLAGIEHLLLTTTGRKTGARRETPLACFRDGDDLLIVASKGGADEPPAWYLNLLAQPSVEIRLGARSESRIAHVANAEERARLWPRLKQENRAYAAYERRTSREIPVVILRAGG